MPRRIYTYEEGMGWDLNNLIASVGAAVLAVAILMLLANIILSLRKPKDAPADPWDVSRHHPHVSGRPASRAIRHGPEMDGACLDSGWEGARLRRHEPRRPPALRAPPRRR
jgi:heme/copper-type cytochrome/quinol oxidase subunit 1